jgi:hypothetical protein
VQSSENSPEPSGEAVSPGVCAVAPSPPDAVAPSALRAWFYTIQLSLRRQSRVGQMAWIAVGFLVFATLVVTITTLGDYWGMHKRRFPRGFPGAGVTYADWANLTESLTYGTALPGSPAVAGINQALVASFRVGLKGSEFYRFSNAAVFVIFVSFLLPLWCLSFATEALGGEREGSRRPGEAWRHRPHGRIPPIPQRQRPGTRSWHSSAFSPDDSSPPIDQRSTREHVAEIVAQRRDAGKGTRALLWHWRKEASARRLFRRPE